MRKILSDALWGMPIGMYIILLIVAGLLITAFFLPPLAIIHKSVLYGAAEIIGGGWLYYTTTHINEFIANGAKIKAQKGDASIEISKGEER